MSSTNATVARPRWALLIPAWLVGNAILGYLLAFPLTSGVLLARHLIGRGPSPLDGDGEVMASVLILVVVAGPLVLAAALVNRAVRRRLALRGPWAAALWSAAAVILLAPLAVFYLGELTVSQMLGKGLLW